MKLLRAGTPSLLDIWSATPQEKRLTDPFWARWILRPLSFRLAWLLVRLGFSANQVSYAGLLTSILAAGLMATGAPALVVLGAILFNFVAILDCTDGNIARLRKQASTYGQWVDAVGGYVAMTCVLFSMGIAAESLKPSTVSWISATNFADLGAFAAVTNLLTRIEYQQFKCLVGGVAQQQIHLEYRFAKNLGLIGLLMPLALFGAVVGLLHWFVVFYAAYHSLGWAVVTIRLAQKLRRLRLA
jgi:phosphatidylglycerophosphate synthase